MTLGETRVALDFLPPDEEGFQPLRTKMLAVKRRLAEAIDDINNLDDMDSEGNVNELKRLKAIAITKLEEASMFSVKAVARCATYAGPSQPIPEPADDRAREGGL